MARERGIWGVYGTVEQARDAYVQLSGHRPRIHTRKVHVEDYDMNVFVLVADVPDDLYAGEASGRLYLKSDVIDR